MVDVYSFKKFDKLLHLGGTHALCILAKWQINSVDFAQLKRHSKESSEPFVTQRPLLGDLQWYIYDVPVKLHGTQIQMPEPQLVIVNPQRKPVYSVE